jgi:mono/diheme cytochrome c family protein
MTLGKAVLAAVLSGMAAAASVVAQQQPTSKPWSKCCGISPWLMAPGLMERGIGQGMMGPGSGSMLRRHFAMASGVPAPYNSLSNPLPRTAETVNRGATVYEQNCASCHGKTGAGDGPVGRTLKPPPASLALLSPMRMVQWDPFMYSLVLNLVASTGEHLRLTRDPVTLLNLKEHFVHCHSERDKGENSPAGRHYGRFEVSEDAQRIGLAASAS